MAIQSRKPVLRLAKEAAPDPDQSIREGMNSSAVKPAAGRPSDNLAAKSVPSTQLSAKRVRSTPGAQRLTAKEFIPSTRWRNAFHRQTRHERAAIRCVNTQYRSACLC